MQNRKDCLPARTEKDEIKKVISETIELSVTVSLRYRQLYSAYSSAIKALSAASGKKTSMPSFVEVFLDHNEENEQHEIYAALDLRNPDVEFCDYYSSCRFRGSFLMSIRYLRSARNIDREIYYSGSQITLIFSPINTPY